MQSFTLSASASVAILKLKEIRLIIKSIGRLPSTRPRSHTRRRPLASCCLIVIV